MPMSRILSAALGHHVTLWVDSCPFIDTGLRGRVSHVAADYITLKIGDDRAGVMIPIDHISGMLDEVLTDEQVRAVRETGKH